MSHHQDRPVYEERLMLLQNPDLIACGCDIEEQVTVIINQKRRTKNRALDSNFWLATLH
jgi:hypothetical protein